MPLTTEEIKLIEGMIWWRTVRSPKKSARCYQKLLTLATDYKDPDCTLTKLHDKGMASLSVENRDEFSLLREQPGNPSEDKNSGVDPAGSDKLPGYYVIEYGYNDPVNGATITRHSQGLWPDYLQALVGVAVESDTQNSGASEALKQAPVGSSLQPEADEHCSGCGEKPALNEDGEVIGYRSRCDYWPDHVHRWTKPPVTTRVTDEAISESLGTVLPDRDPYCYFCGRYKAEYDAKYGNSPGRCIPPFTPQPHRWVWNKDGKTYDYLPSVDKKRFDPGEGLQMLKNRNSNALFYIRQRLKNVEARWDEVLYVTVEGQMLENEKKFLKILIDLLEGK